MNLIYNIFMHITYLGVCNKVFAAITSLVHMIAKMSSKFASYSLICKLCNYIALT